MQPAKPVPERADRQAREGQGRFLSRLRRVWRRYPHKNLSRDLIPTIVEHTDRKSTRNEYSVRMISPPRPGRCCTSNMVDVGDPEQAGESIFQYRRCTKCGFTVRRILHEVWEGPVPRRDRAFRQGGRGGLSRPKTLARESPASRRIGGMR